MNLLEYLAIAAALLPVLYIWCKPLGVYRWVYIRVSRCVNGWSKLTMEVEDSRGHVH